MEKGELRLDLNFQFHPLTRLVHEDDYVSFSRLEKRSPEAAEHGDADFYIFQTDLVPRYAVSDYTEAFLDLPYKVLTVRVDEDDEHHRDETFEGLGDIRLGFKRFLFHEDSFQLAGILGISFPTGRLNKVTAASYLDHDEAMALGVQVAEHSHLQLGTGTFDPFVGLEALVRLGDRWMLFGSANANLPFYENRYDYRTSPSGTLNLGPAVQIGETRLIAGLFGEVFYSGRDRFRGNDVVGPGGRFDGTFWVPNTGRFEAAIKPTLTWGITDNLTLNAQARIPVYTRIREDSERGDVQLTEPVGVFVGTSYNF